MRTLLVSGAFHTVLSKYGLDIVNNDSITIDEILPFLQQTQIKYEQIVITDDSMSNNDNYSITGFLKSLLLFQETENNKQPVLLVTNNVMLQDMRIQGIDTHFYYTTRIPISQYLSLIHRPNVNGLKAAGRKQAASEMQISITKAAETAPPAKKHSFIERLKKDKALFSSSSSSADREFSNISNEISRVIAITGCRGSGVTSTAVNLAQIASNKGLSTMLIDLDVANCALNLYFNEYYDTAEKDKNIACSLIRNLAKPQDYKLNTYNKGNLYLTTLSYSFQDKELLERFYTVTKLVNMLSVFRKHFQICLLDMPFEVLGKFTESILYIDGFGLCVPNNLYSLTGTLRSSQNLFSKEELESLHSKSKIIVTKYNDQVTLQDEFFSADKVCELLLELSDTYYEKGFELAGYIPYVMDFDLQLETDIPISDNNSHMEKAYADILLRMIKGVR